MGKRKAAKKPQGKKKVKLDKKAGVGELNCKVCNQQFQCSVNYLSAAVDVYSEWVDACDAVAQGTGDGEGGEHAPARAPVQPGGAKQRNDDEDDNDDDIIDDEDDHIGYGGEGVAADDEY
ncbi:putative Transcription elongation factor 1 like protein [Glarea lozoyensis 74030]|uniref:Transcription elongation factor 1 homolog n=1 Tax=Glarea lozoyensis (strain ATCC 74030 / MF5533) TaxID=1104152 RepID=H0EIG9_GLAL7|nr:putative Transcription elongation factor 1 like protein [Glarea lozoyensis 74030]